jgi:hypothetical protein
VTVSFTNFVFDNDFCSFYADFRGASTCLIDTQVACME